MILTKVLSMPEFNQVIPTYGVCKHNVVLFNIYTCVTYFICRVKEDLKNRLLVQLLFRWATHLNISICVWVCLAVCPRFL